jgi:hypothetical protein
MVGFDVEGWAEAGCEALLVDLRSQRRAVLEQPHELLAEAAHAEARVLDLVEVRDQCRPLLRRRRSLGVLSSSSVMFSSISPATSRSL